MVLPSSPPVSTTMTFGIAEVQEGATVDDCLRRADQAMYSGKQAGKNRVVIDPTAPALSA
jgi:PleD family two-component response regulator